MSHLQSLSLRDDQDGAAVVQSLRCFWLFATPWTATCQASLSFSISQSLLKFMFIKLMKPSNHLILCHCLLLLPPIFPSTRVCSCESVVHIRWLKYYSFSFSIVSSNEYSGLNSFRIDWFDLLVVQETLTSLLQHHNLKASVLWHSAFFMVQLSHPYLTTGKTIALTRWTFLGKVMSLLFNMLPWYVIASKEQVSLVSRLQSWSVVILELKKMKSVTVLIVPPSICHEVMGPDAMILVFWILNFKPLFHCPLLPSSRASLVSLCFLLLGCCHLHIWGYWYLSQESWFQLVVHPAGHFTWYVMWNNKLL